MSIEGVARRILIHGMSMVLVGLLFGVVIPNTPFPRLALAAHIQFMTNGLLFIVLATLLIALKHTVGLASVRVMLVSAYLAWAMALSAAANAWWGASRMLPIAAGQAGATGAAAWQELIVTVAHVAGGAGIIVAWALLLYGFVKPRAPSP